MLFGELSLFQLISISLFGFIFGIFETSTNFYYLVSKNLNLPRKQHGTELPSDASDFVVFKKVLQMFYLGIILLITAFLSIFLIPQIFVIGAAAIFLSALIDYGKFQNTKMFVIWLFIASIAGAFVLATVP